MQLVYDHRHTRHSLRSGAQGGSSLVEVLVALVLFTIMGVSLIRSAIASQNSLARTTRNSLATQLALETLESYYPIDPITLDNGDDYTGSVTRDGVTFSRAVDITVNADESRTVTVTIGKSNSAIESSVSISNTFALQGSS